MNQFSERYKTLSHSELLKIIENHTDYQEAAVEAARHEIQQRNLSEQELTEAKTILEVEQETRHRQTVQKTAVEQKVKTLGTSIFETLIPIHHGIPTPEKIIRSISLVFGFMAAYQLFSEFKHARFLRTDGIADWSISLLEFLLPRLFLPVAVFLFWKRKKTGWILMASYLTYASFSAVAFLILIFNTGPIEFYPFDSYFPQFSPLTQLMTILFFGGTLWVLNKKTIREHFNISKQAAIRTMVIVGALLIAFMTSLLL